MRGEALAAARTISDKLYRTRALVALAPHMAPEEQGQVWDEALVTTHSITDEYHYAQAFRAFVPYLAQTPEHDHLLIPTLSRLARQGRPALLSDIVALTPWIIAYTERTSQPTALKELVRAITETAYCWP